MAHLYKLFFKTLIFERLYSCSISCPALYEIASRTIHEAKGAYSIVTPGSVHQTFNSPLKPTYIAPSGLPSITKCSNGRQNGGSAATGLWKVSSVTYASLLAVLTYSKKAQYFTKFTLSSIWGPGCLYDSLLCLFRAFRVLYFQTLVTSRTLSPFSKPLTWSSLGRSVRMRSSDTRMGYGR